MSESAVVVDHRRSAWSVPEAGCAARPIRVGFVLHRMQVAGAEVLVADIIRRAEGRLEPTILCLDGVGELGERMLAEGVPVVNLGRRPGRDWRVALRMAGELRRRRIELIHAHQYTPFFYAALAKIASGRWPRLVLTEHGRNYPDVVSPARRLANRLVLGHLADAITGVCEFSLRQLDQADGFSPRRFRVIENGVEPGRYERPRDRAATRVRLGLDPGRRYLTCVARFHPVKDHDMLLRAFREVAARRPDADLLLVGDGELRGRLEEQAGMLGLAPRVRFLGVRPDVAEILGVCDLFVLASKSEAASLSIMEAMSAELPVVATAVGGNPEIVLDGRTGLLVPRGDAQAMAAAVLQLLDRPAHALAMGEAGRARARERYRLDLTAEAYIALYRDLIPTDG
jgi:glycosyltransferase involved in cell wall biosynthesis